MSRVEGNHRDFFLWIDAVGGYRVCLGQTVTLGQPDADPMPPGRLAEVDVAILADLSQRHARVRRDGEGYLIEAFREVHVDGRQIQGVSTLGDGNRVRLGATVELAFRRPHPLSATARLDFVSSHRTQPAVDAVLLMADACVLGPKSQSHVVCRDWPDEVVLFRRGGDLFCRSTGPFRIDGRVQRERGLIRPGSQIVGERFSMSLEPIEP